jgi:hypothetical protein
VLIQRSRYLGDMLGNLGTSLGFFILTTKPVAVEAVKLAKPDGGNARLAAAVKRAFEPYLARYFRGFRLTVPRGSGKDTFMLRLWRSDPRFLACFDHETAVGCSNDWRARLAHYPDVPLTCDVRGLRIVLLDDVVTTGTTLVAHLLPLLRGGALATALVLTS